MSTTTEGILRLEEVPRGSTIWDLASQNIDIIFKHAFWEIRNGNSAKFWDEAWQQRERMIEFQGLQNMCQKAKAEGLNYGSEYWKEESQGETLRTWKKPKEWDSHIDLEQRDIFVRETKSRRITIRTSLDILWWGRSTKGTSTIREAYYLTIQQQHDENSPMWK